MNSRRHFLSQSAAALLALHGRTRARADLEVQPDGSAVKGLITPATQTAIDRGLAYLARCQHQDGSFGTGQHRGNVAITSLAALAFMAAGHQPGRGA